MGIVKKIKNKWNVDVVRRLEICREPSRYVDKNLLLEYQKEIIRRSLLSFNEVEDLSISIDDSCISSCTTDTSEPLFYGAIQAILEYANLSCINMPPKRLGIQHGYVFELRDWEKSKLTLGNLVWSKRLVEMYHEYTSNPDVCAIGAPFFYAKPLLKEEQFKAEKNRLGKNLLAFPMHSQSHVDTNYDPLKFLNILCEERKRFDTVRVCMYWKDIQRGSHKVFEDAGFECVCNGHLYDTNFLRRQKSLFELADAKISNGVGSHIGYSIYMG